LAAKNSSQTPLKTAANLPFGGLYKLILTVTKDTKESNLKKVKYN
jgi:hypothetical protein